ncbi:O-methyltransferase family 3 [Alloalcanivorax dieselolei B5]|uniref:O-methyltransferase family 3 n=1 Tax=Alcanivorax dieselolei (strain DSM 16502 / CGMCC 1.3690 / MCCC 1A00001 / B-5) TaxID=930169 RepID=K0CD95_ALCDB|nr:class I SAM-dependent methyltransferase [Alloalcanivorax dieselolei]AFT69541.1 O-methyltransferase family 3 [Alloalcanivorax dieselolei B5]GGK04406.1 hypothetical protein GCM10007426_36590 [Alloalcanivorax dieselolei]
MTSLTTAPLENLISRLFAEADAATSPALQTFTDEERATLNSSKVHYRQLYGRLKDLWLPVSPETGRLLYMLVRSAHARNIVEFGTSFGLSTLHLGAALRDEGGGRVISTEFESTKVERARAHVTEAGLDDLIEIREGDALNTLSMGLPEQIDLLVLDGAKALYPDILDLVESRLGPGAWIVADDADKCPDYIERIRNDPSYLSVPFAEDIELSMKLA